MKLASVLILFAFSAHAAESVYPKQLPTRILGTDQRLEDSARADAEVGALEQIFANGGLPIGLSTYYQNAKTLNGSGADRELLEQNGPVLPDFMWPEDGSLLGETLGGTRPSVSQQAVVDPEFAEANEWKRGFGFKQTNYNFGSSFTSGNLAHLKKLVRERRPVVLTLNGALFQSRLDAFDKVSGLLKVDYGSVRETLRTDPVNHTVTVVGYDDDLKALIVRNTWNSMSEIAANFDVRSITPEQQAQLAKMKGKMSSLPLPGYFAVPYVYIEDLAAWKKGGYSVYSFNADSFLETYEYMKKRYSTFAAPFSCDRAKVIELLKNFRRHKLVVASATASENERKAARKAIFKMLLDQVSRTSRTLQFAKLAYNEQMPQVDRVAEFYSGKFNDAYCGDDAGSMFPKAGDLRVKLTATSHPGWFTEIAVTQSEIQLWDRVLTWMLENTTSLEN